jgi:hypothetical protein
VIDVESLTRGAAAPRLSRLAAYTGIALLVAPFAYHLARGTGDHVMLVTDDFWYYALVARNVASHGRFTFDGITSTNGFHPLFMPVLIGLSWLAKGITPAFFAGLAAVFAAAGIAAFELYLALGRRVFPRLPLVPAAAVLAALASMRMMVWGMETTLAVPLYVWTLLEIAKTESLTLRRAAWLGFVCSLLVLARLDQALFVATLFAAVFVVRRREPALELQAAFAFAAGGFLLPVYLGWNLAEFGTLSPVSGQAKQLREGFGFSALLLQSLWASGYVRIAVALVPPALLVLTAAGQRLFARSAAFTALLGMVFPVVLYGVLGLSSDWTLFPWYLYPVPTALFFAALVLVRLVTQAAPRFTPDWAAASLSLAALVLSVGVAARVCWSRTLGWGESQRSNYTFAFELAERTKDLEGVFAMGDRAGLTAFLLQKPVVQLEGLIADPAMVGHIRRKDPLDKVLREYGVDYLIVFLYRPMDREDGCYRVSSPDRGQAGTHSKQMVGKFCKQPVVQFTTQLTADPARPQPFYVYVLDVR